MRAETGASGNTQASSVDNGASSANDGAAYLRVSDLAQGSYISVTLKVRHSAYSVTFVDLATFTNITAAHQAQHAAVAGTVNRYLAAAYLFNAAGAARSISIMAGFARLAADSVTERNYQHREPGTS